MLKKGTALLFGLLLLFGLSAGVSAEPSVVASSAVVMDYDTGAVYYAKAPDTPRITASVTKVMTAYLIFEAIDKGQISYDTVVTFTSSTAPSAFPGYSNVPFAAGESYTVDTLLKTIFVESACSACALMAETIAGSQSAFVKMMNNKAAELGIDAYYMDCFGATNNTITARGLAVLSAELIANYPDVLKYSSLKSLTFKGTTYQNTNKLLGTYTGADGLKTGTNSYGANLAATACRDNRRIVVALMGSTSSSCYSDATKLLDYGFTSQAAADNSFGDMTLSLSATREQARIGAYETVNLGSSSSVPLGGRLTLTINGETVISSEKITIGGGSVYSCTFVPGETETSQYEVVASVVGYNGTVKTVTLIIPQSDEEPCAFPDIDGHWAESYITSLKASGVIGGYPDGTFKPGNNVTRGEFAKMLTVVLQDKGIISEMEEHSSFEDMDGHWADSYVGTLENAGLVSGVGNNKFNPDVKITRQEIAVLIARAFKLEATTDSLSFTDTDEIADWALQGVIACYEGGICSGYPDLTFKPTSSATRGEAAKMLYVAANQYNQSEPEE